MGGAGSEVATPVLTDEALLARAGRGDDSAFGELYLRHRGAARFVAGQWTPTPADADDAVAEGFVRVFAALSRMDPDRVSFRRYLLATVRNVAKDRLRKERRVHVSDDIPEAPSPERAEAGALSAFERDTLAEALTGLPARWRTVLWLTEVEGLTPAAAAVQLGMTPNAVAALAYRARKRLRQTYLQAHLRAPGAEECQPVVGLMSGYVRRLLDEPGREAVEVHLAGCAACQQRLVELSDVNATFRQAMLPVASILARAGEMVSTAVTTGGGRVAARAGAAVAVGVLALAAPGSAPDGGSPVAPPAAAAAATPVGDATAGVQEAAAGTTGLLAGSLGQLVSRVGNLRLALAGPLSPEAVGAAGLPLPFDPGGMGGVAGTVLDGVLPGTPAPVPAGTTSRSPGSRARAVPPVPSGVPAGFPDVAAGVEAAIRAAQEAARQAAER